MIIKNKDFYNYYNYLYINLTSSKVIYIQKVKSNNFIN